MRQFPGVQNCVQWEAFDGAVIHTQGTDLPSKEKKRKSFVLRSQQIRALSSLPGVGDQWGSFLGFRTVYNGKSADKGFVNLHIAINCIKQLMGLLLDLIILPEFVWMSFAYVSSVIFSLLCWQKGCTSICTRQTFCCSVLLTICILHDRSVWMPYKQRGILIASCAHIASNPLVETSSTLRKGNRTVRKVGAVPYFVRFFLSFMNWACG